ncbi:MAG: hypothetical protein H6726_07515 [Sandaracinaceae bacterium]|nr:hypothetical protein [Sandaracinaceae bacterium]
MPAHHARPWTRRLLAALCMLASVSAVDGTPVAAQGRRAPEPPPVMRMRRAVDLGAGRVARVRTEIPMQGPGAGAWLELPDDVVVPLHEGSPTVATATTGHGSLLVAFASERLEGSPRFAVRRAELGEGAPRVEEARPITRPSAPLGSAFGVAATTTPEGFTVFFQELDARDQSLARTFMARVGPDGVPRGATVEVPVPWGIAAAAWNGAGYHLALNYPAGNGVRLSMVSLTPEGSPQQHPDWASAAGVVMDVHLATEAGRVMAYFRGGPTGEDLLAADVTQIGQWGREPPAPRRVSRLEWDQLIVVSAGAGARAVR